MKRYLLTVFGGVEADVHGPYPDEDARFAAAVDINDEQDRASDSLFTLDIGDDGEPYVGVFSAVAFDDKLREPPYNATYTSIWEYGDAITTCCVYDPLTKRCTDTKMSDALPTGSMVDEYVTFDGSQLRADDGVTFDY